MFVHSWCHHDMAGYIMLALICRYRRDVAAPTLILLCGPQDVLSWPVKVAWQASATCFLIWVQAYISDMVSVAGCRRLARTAAGSAWLCATLNVSQT